MMQLQELATDVLIIGAGPAGLTAGLYAARANKKVIVLEGKFPSWITTAHKVENYPGVVTSGKKLLATMRDQAVQFGVELITGDVFEAMLAGDTKMVTTREHLISAKAIILALGRGSKQKLISNEESFLGKGVSYCAICDGSLYKGKKVVVYGIDKEAEQDAEYLKGLGCDVTLILAPAKIAEIIGTNKVTSIRVERANKVEEITVDALFIIQAVNPTVLLDKLGVVLTPDKKIIVDPKTMQTNISGVYAAGDITGYQLQVAVAVGQGCLAGLAVVKYLRS
jgi:thioredoxin reductase (NADPH)